MQGGATYPDQKTDTFSSLQKAQLMLIKMKHLLPRSGAAL